MFKRRIDSRGIAFGAIAALITTSAVFGQRGQPAAPAELPENVTLSADITYAIVDGHELRLDLYKPVGADNPPLVVWVHGGGWRAGSRKGVNGLELVDRGYAIASVSYRLTPVAAFPAQVHDIKGAIRYLRANANQLGIDASRIAVMGVSAGAHLAALAGVTNGSPEHEGTVGDNLDVSSDAHAIVSFFGASNLTTILGQSTEFGLGIRVPALELLFGGPPEAHADLARLASPVFFVEPSDPPMFLLHGDADPQMPIEQTFELHEAALFHGIDARLDVVSGAGHGGAEFFEPARIAAVAQFLDAHLRHVDAN
jgi:acetyl esterase/lipase